MDKLTTKSQEMLTEAIRLATDTGNLQVESLHLLAAFLAQQGGVAMALLDAIGVNCGEVGFRADAALAALSAFEGSSVQQPGAFRAFPRIISGAGEGATVLNDAYISTKHLLIAVIAP